MAVKTVLVALTLSLLATSRCESKVIRGTANSLEAWKQNGQFIAKFCFHDKHALFKYSISGSTNGSSQGKWYFYLDETWEYAQAEKDCAKKIAMAKFNRDLTATSGQQYINQWIRPHFWFIFYADAHTCNSTPPPVTEVVEYEMTFLNPDYNGVSANDHFGDDLRGLLTFYCLLVLVYIGGIALYAHKVWSTIKKGGPMHDVLKMLSVAMTLHFSGALLMLTHLWRYSMNGEGVPFFETCSEALEMFAQCQMVWMLLSMSVGWTLGSTTAHPFKDKYQLSTNTVVAVLHIILVLWEQTYDESQYTYHLHESLPGLLLTLLRVGLAGLFWYNLKHTISKERSTLRKDFYQSFAIGCYLWFLSFPFLMLLTTLFAQYWRHKVMVIGVTLIQTTSMGLLSRLFLSRSLYWEVSTLSSTTLPLRMDRGGGGGIHGYLTKLN